MDPPLGYESARTATLQTNLRDALLPLRITCLEVLATGQVSRGLNTHPRSLFGPVLALLLSLRASSPSHPTPLFDLATTLHARASPSDRSPTCLVPTSCAALAASPVHPPSPALGPRARPRAATPYRAARARTDHGSATAPAARSRQIAPDRARSRKLTRDHGRAGVVPALPSALGGRVRPPAPLRHYRPPWRRSNLLIVLAVFAPR